jgi:hypothetical protein
MIVLNVDKHTIGYGGGGMDQSFGQGNAFASNNYQRKNTKED